MKKLLLTMALVAFQAQGSQQTKYVLALKALMLHGISWMIAVNWQVLRLS